MIKFRLKLFFIILLLNVSYSYQESAFDDEIKKDNGDQQVSNENIELTSKQVCTPHEVKMEDCNRCRCAANGIGWFCTRKACPPKPLNRKKRRVAVNSPEFRCTPGETFMDDCNTCWCHESGKLAACTLMACPPRNLRKRETSSSEPPKLVCKPGETWMDDCNRCWCDKTGTSSMCTEMGCIHFTTVQKETKVVEKRSASGPPSSYCTPGQTFMEDCNTCICHESGNFAACTMMACERIKKREVSASDPTSPPPFKCTPGETFMMDCNRCWCDKTGTSALCTLKGCYRRSPKEVEKTIQKRSVASSGSYCNPGEFYMDDCNSCICHESGEFASCTMMACPPKHSVKKRSVSSNPPPPGMKCTPGESYQKDCNKCWCNPSGEFFSCTMMECMDKSIVKRSVSMRAEINSPDFKCTPGEVFMEQCNTCTCTASGREAACTLMYCEPTENETRLVKRNINESTAQRKVTEAEYRSPSFKCEPGENFKLDCNTCQCNSDGKTALWCTRIGCLKNINFQNEIQNSK